MGMGNVSGQSNNVVYTSKTAPPEVLEAAKKRMEAAEANGFEGYKKIEPSNFEDGSEVSQQSASISKNLKNASEEVKEMLKNPNAFTDCFPDMKSPKGPKNMMENGGTKTPLTDEQIQAKLQKLESMSEGASTLTPMSAEEIAEMPKSPKGPINQMGEGSMKASLTEEQMQAKLQAMAEGAQNMSTLTPMSAEEIANMQKIK